jgi:ABC-type uncharacterized transport system substrate-binding protein
LQPLREGRVRIDTVTAARLLGVDTPTYSGYELVVTVGLAAAQAATSRENSLPVGPPMLCLLIPRQSFEKLASPHGGSERRLSAVFIDQPLSRQLDLLHLALPERHRVGIIVGPSSQELVDDLRSEARSRSLNPTFAKVAESSGVYSALQTVMPESDLLLLLPDPVATNADTVYGLLLTSYRAQIPVVGFSEGLLNAGALVALYSTARQQGKQGAEIASRILARTGGLPAPQNPHYFTVRVNASVARSFGLHLPAETVLHDALIGQDDGAGDNTRGSTGGTAPRSEP